MFAADAYFQVRPGKPSIGYSEFDELAHAVPVQRRERVARPDSFLEIGGNEFGVVPGKAISELGQIVGAE